MSVGTYNKTDAEYNIPGSFNEPNKITTEKSNPFTYEKQVDLNDERVKDNDKTNTKDVIGLNEPGVDGNVGGECEEDDRRFMDTSSQRDGEEQVDIGLNVGEDTGAPY